MDVSYTDSWDKIQKGYQAGVYGSGSHLKAKAALEIKSAIDSAKNTKRLILATWVLAVFTILLFLSTLFYAVFTYKSYKSSYKQTEALRALTEAVVKLPKNDIGFNKLEKK